MRLYLHKTLLSLLICSLAGPVLHADTASPEPVKSDINQARITDGDFKFPGIIASVPASVASLPLQAASIAVEIPVQEIPAIDNLIKGAAQVQPILHKLATPAIDAATKAASGNQSVKNSLATSAAGGIELSPGLNLELNKIPGMATASAAIAGTDTSPAPASSGMALTASATAAIKKSKDSEYIDTLFPDPLSPDFPSESGISEAEKNRPAKEIIDEINQKAEEIAEQTAKELGIEYIPPSERMPATETAVLEASASGDLEPETPETASGEARVVTEADSGSWEYPGDTKASAAAKIKAQVLKPGKKEPGSTVKENEITEEPETGIASSTKTTIQVKKAEQAKTAERGKPVEVVKAVEAGAASGSENIGEKAAVDSALLASETVVTETENEIIPVQWPDSPEDPEFASGSQQLFSEKTASSTSSSGELPGLFEKAEALAPSLMTRGKPEDEQSGEDEIKKITGRLVPEKQPLGRRRHLYRWVLKTDDGRRIPLKSNLKLLSEVRNEKMLDGKVNLSGRFIKSGMNQELQYFVVESATFADSANASGTADIKTGKPAETNAALTGSRQPANAKNDAVNPSKADLKSSPPKTGKKADKIGSNVKTGTSGTKNAAKKQDLPSDSQNLKKAPLPEQP